MSARIEKYLIGNRKDIDVESPDDSVWEKIQAGNRNRVIKRLNTKVRLLRIRNIAATAVILFSLGYIANDVVSGRILRKPVTLSSIDSDLGRREKEYKTLLNFKTEEVRSIAGTEDEIITQLFDEISKLDMVYGQAMADLRVLGPDERIINTIFSTYEQKIRLLELIILETNKKSHENNEKIIL